MKYPLLIAFSLLVTLTGSAQEIMRPVQLKSGILKKTINLRNDVHFSDSLVKYRFRNKFYTLIQFSKLPDIAERQALASEGILLYDYIPDNTYLAEINDQLVPGQLKKSIISGVYTLDATTKIAPALKQQLTAQIQDPDKLIAVSFFGNVDKTTAVTELKQAGAQIVDTRIQPAHVVFINATAATVDKIATLPFVAYISSQHMKSVALNHRSRAAHGIDILSSPAGRNLQGSNVTLGLGDDGDATLHIDVSGRLINRNPVGPGGHGTATMGVMSGAGIMNQRYKGMAPKSTMVGQYFSDILANTPYYMTDFGMVVTNNSYHSAANGCIGQGDYDVLSYYVDAQLNSNPSLLHVFASGNDGSLTCSPYPASFATVKSGFQTGKNVLTVGASDNNNNYVIAALSSRGPVDDGRLKPEIVAGGNGIATTIPTNVYSTLYGTSMASPAVAGALGLLYERYRQLHGGANPTGALMKAITCNTADDLGNPGPDFTFGFGNLNARYAVEAIENNAYFTGAVSHGGSQNFTITGVPAGTQQIKIMLYYSDPAGTPYAATSLINNLNLSVTAPDASVHNPLILNPSVGTVNNVAVEGIDNRNNIEQVVINNPPAGNFNVTVTGAYVPQGPQNFVVTWQAIAPTFEVLYPIGGETMVPGEFEVLRWIANDANTNTFTIEYSTNNGSSWTLIDNNVAADQRTYIWTTPNTPTNTALFRVSRNDTANTDVGDNTYSIMTLPTLTLSNTCAGYINYSWTAVPGATSYDVMMYRGTDMSVVTNTTGTSYLLGGLNKDSAYYLAVRAVMGSTPGRRCLAQLITPSGGACASPTFDNDLTTSALPAPVTGRMFTTSQLGIVAPQVTVKNLSSAGVSGTFDVTYQINNATPVTETTTQSIAANGTYTHTFAATYDFSATGTYTIKSWVTYTSDPSHINDTLVKVIKNLQNSAIVLSPSFTEGFESATANAYTTGTRGFDGLDRCDFFASSNNGRARTFVNTGIARTGNRAATLDQIANLGVIQTDSLITTYNLSSYAPTDQIWLSFYFKNQGIDFSAANNRVYIRGNENSAWLPVYTLPNSSADFGVYRASTPVNITETLANAVPAQTISSSFQIKFCEMGYRSTNSVVVDGNLDDGYTFDDITLTLTTDDVSMMQLVNPAGNICALSNAEPITVQVKNYSTGNLSSVPVSYQIDNGTIVTENIPTINAGQTVNFTFGQTANLSVYKVYTFKSWVGLGTDTYHVNDTISTTFRTAPQITSFPYLEGFESNDGNWYTGGINSSWAWGTPAKTIINKAANGTKAWVTNLTGLYNNNELSYLYSPCFNLTGLTTPVLSFSHIFRMEDNCPCDFHWVEYSTDGTNWIKLGNVGGGTNWYDNPAYQSWQMSDTRWHVSSFDVPVKTTGVRFRILMYGDPGVTYEGVGIDDIHVFDKAVIYSGANITSGLSQPVSGSSWIHFNSGGNRVVSINPNGQNLGTTDVKVYFNPSGTVRNDGSQYYLDRNIVIQPTTAPSAPVSVRYYFLNSEANNLINATGCGSCNTIADAYEAGVTKYSNAPAEENGTLADNLTGIHSFITPTNVDVIPYDNGYYAEYQVSSFSEFWINGGGPGHNQPLPLTMGMFTVTKNNATALLQWTTLQENNTAEFVIERSTDGINYEAIGTVVAGGNTNTESKYQFTDKQLAAGINYYRIKTVDKDAKYNVSGVRSVNNTNNDFTISLLPNPVTRGMAYISTSVNCNRIELRDATGRLIKTVIVKGTHNSISVDGLTKGVYFVSVFTDSGSKIEKLFVE